MYRFIKILPVLVVTLVGLAADPTLDVLEETGRWKELRARVQGWKRTSPQDPYALLWEAKVQAAFGQLATAEASLRNLVSKHPGNVDFMAELAEVLGVQAQKADGRLKQFGYAREMKKLGEQVLALQPRHKSINIMMIQYYTIAPGIVGGDTDKARALAHGLAAVDPALAEGQLGFIAMQGKDKAKAEAHYRKAVAVAKDPYHALVDLGSFLYRQDTPATKAEAVQHVQKALALHADRMPALSFLAQVSAVEGKREEATAWIQRIEKAFPGNLNPHYQVARNLVTQGQHLDLAETLLRRYLDTDREPGGASTAAAQWRLAQVKEKQGQKAEALALLEQALGQEPNLDGAKKDLKRLKG